MVMEIVFRHVFERGVHLVELVRFKVMSKDRLPKQYVEVDNMPLCYTFMSCGNKALLVKEANGSTTLRYANYKVGARMPVEEMEWIVKSVAAAGNRLHAINYKINQEKREFEGKVEKFTF